MGRHLVMIAMSGALAAAAGSAHAQTAMDAVVSGIASAAQENACQAGKGGPDERWRAAHAVRVDEVIARYVTASRSGDQAIAQALYSTGRSAGVAGTDGVVARPGTPLPGFPIEASLKRDQLVFATDAGSARGLWTASGGGQSYTVDLVRTRYTNSWKVWRIRAVALNAPITLPEYYCHAQDLAALW